MTQININPSHHKEFKINLNSDQISNSPPIQNKENKKTNREMAATALQKDTKTQDNLIAKMLKHLDEAHRPSPISFLPDTFFDILCISPKLDQEHLHGFLDSSLDMLKDSISNKKYDVEAKRENSENLVVFFSLIKALAPEYNNLEEHLQAFQKENLILPFISFLQMKKILNFMKPLSKHSS